jgi:hypothetical protein
MTGHRVQQIWIIAKIATIAIIEQTKALPLMTLIERIHAVGKLPNYQITQLPWASFAA